VITIELVAVKEVHSSTGVIRPGVLFSANETQAKYYLTSGQAVRPPAPETPKWSGLLWRGCEVVILASGESLSTEQCEQVYVWRGADTANRKVVAINTTFRRAPWADVIYACDSPWWDKYIGEVRLSCSGSMWTQDEVAFARYGIHRIRSRKCEGLSTQPGIIHQGENSGYQCIGLAQQAGAKKIYLLGFDMRGGHWHGDHPGGLKKQNQYDRWLSKFPALATGCSKAGVAVINCTPDSALTVFPYVPWTEAFTL